MSILISLLWIVIGIIYIVYKGLKEERETTLHILIVLGLLFLPVLFVVTIDEPPSWIGILVILCWVIEIITVITITNRRNGFYSKNKEKEICKLNSERLVNLEKELSDAGYYIKYSIGLNGKKESVSEIVKREVHFVPLYNRKENRPATINEIYERLCAHQTYCLIESNDEVIEELIDIPLDLLPINPRIEQSTVREYYIREAQHRFANAYSLRLAAARTVVSKS